MTGPVGPVNELVAAIRAQLAAQPRRQLPVRSAKPARLGAREAPQAAQIALRVAQIDCDDPERARKAFRVFLEAVLCSQFGAGLIHDPAFYQLVTDVHQALDAQEQLAPMMAAAMAHLLGDNKAP